MAHKGCEEGVLEYDDHGVRMGLEGKAGLHMPVVEEAAWATALICLEIGHLGVADCC